MQKKIVFLIVLAALVFLFLGCTQPVITPTGSTFSTLEGSTCKENGKPVVRMFSTNICPHCNWVKETFDSVAKEYVDANKIVAYHWVWIIDTNTGTLTGGDDSLTPQYEGTIPAGEEAVFKQFSPKESVPAFIFGCKYYRIGNGFEQQNDLNAERTEFKIILDKLIAESQ